jgi:CubicO group peptidase (beta-lactamase class C family)
MIHSKITDGPYPEKDIAHAYRNVNGIFEEYDYGEYPTFAASGNGGIWSSVNELAKYVMAIKQCSFLDCKSIEFSKTAWQPENWIQNNPSTQGYSWVIEETKGKYKMISHSGSQGGFRAHLFMIPQPDITIIWLTNNNRMLTGFIMQVLNETGYLK